MPQMFNPARAGHGGDYGRRRHCCLDRGYGLDTIHPPCAPLLTVWPASPAGWIYPLAGRCQARSRDYCRVCAGVPVWIRFDWFRRRRHGSDRDGTFRGKPEGAFEGRPASLGGSAFCPVHGGLAWRVDTPEQAAQLLKGGLDIARPECIAGYIAGASDLIEVRADPRQVVPIDRAQLARFPDQDGARQNLLPDKIRKEGIGFCGAALDDREFVRPDASRN